MNTIGSFSSFSERLHVYRSQTKEVGTKFTNVLNSQQEEIIAEKKFKAIAQSDTKITIKNVIETAKSLKKTVTADIEGEYVTFESEEAESARTGLERLNVEYGVVIKEAISLKRKTTILDKESAIFYNALTATLQHKDSKIRSEIISNFFLVETLPEKIIPNFIEALQDNDAQVRLNAALALHKHIILPDYGVEILLDAFENISGEYSAVNRINATLGLGNQYGLSKKANILAALHQALQDDNEQVRLRAAISLSEYITLSDEGIEILLHAFENASGEYSAVNRIHATLGLDNQYGLSKKANILAVLYQALQDDNKQVRLIAAISLSEYITLPDEGIQILLDAFENISGEYSAVNRINATLGLGNQYGLSKKANILAVLHQALQDDSEQVRLMAAINLSVYIKLSDEGIQILLDAFENASGEYSALYRKDAICGLGNQYGLSKKESILAVLHQALQDDNEQVRLRAAISLSEYITLSDDGIQILLDAFENASGKYSALDRKNAICELDKQYGLSKKENILAILNNALQDENEHMRLEAAAKLSEHIMLSDEGIQILLDAFENASGTYSALDRGNAIRGLGKQYELSKKESVLTVLHQALQDENEQVRLDAAVNLSEHIMLSDEGIQILLDVSENVNGEYDAIDRLYATFGLGQQYELSKKESIFAALHQALQDDNKKVRLRAAIDLSKYTTLSDDGIQILLDAFENASGEYSALNRENAIFGLGKQYRLSKKENILAILRQALQDNDEQVRLNAAKALKLSE